MSKSVNMKTIKTKSRKEFNEAVKKVFDEMMSMSKEELLKEIEKYKKDDREDSSDT